LSVSCFGGPQAHIAHFQKLLVEKRKYITEEELIELNALGQVLPGPTSTQTLTAIAYRRPAKPRYSTLHLSGCSSVAIMTFGIADGKFETKQVSLASHASSAYGRGFCGIRGLLNSGNKTVTRPRVFILTVAAAVSSYFIKTPLVFPIILIVAGCIMHSITKHTRGNRKKSSMSPGQIWCFGLGF